MFHEAYDVKIWSVYYPRHPNIFLRYGVLGTFWGSKYRTLQKGVWMCRANCHIFTTVYDRKGIISLTSHIRLCPVQSSLGFSASGSPFQLTWVLWRCICTRRRWGVIWQVTRFFFRLIFGVSRWESNGPRFVVEGYIGDEIPPRIYRDHNKPWNKDPFF